MRTNITLLAICFCFAAPAAAQTIPAEEPTALHVRDVSFDPLKTQPAVHAALRATQETGYSLVQYHAGRGEAVLGALIAAHARIYGPVARHGFLVGNITQRQLRAIKGVRYAGTFHPAYKLDPGLRAQALKSGAAKVTVLVEAFENAPRIAKTISAYAKATLVGERQERILVELAERDLKRVAAIPDVRNIEPATIPLKLLDVAPSRIGVRTAARQPNYDGLDGTGQQLGIYDGGTDTGNTGTLVLDLRGRVSGDTANWANPSAARVWTDLNYDGTNSGHGTAVTDMAIGNGATSSTALLTGVAPRATAIMRPHNADSNGLVPGNLDITTALTNAYAWGARVHNDSWGPATGTYPNLTAVLNTYATQTSAATDQFTYTNWQMLVVLAGGNSGPNANTISTLATSKNGLVVGNSGNGNPPTGSGGGGGNYDGVAPNLIEPSSSVGPAPGNRLKPEISAPGQQIAFVCMAAMVTDGDCPWLPYIGEPNFTYAGGTSAAAPIVSGTALLVRQLLARDTLLPNASGMLVKALLVNGASQLFNYAPSNTQGWGLINLPQSVAGFGGGDVYYYDSMTERGGSFRFVQAGQSVVFENVVLAPGVPFNVTLTWYDPPDATLAGRLVNDLNLTLTLQNGTVYRAGVPSMQNGVTVAGGAADAVNNTEKLILAATPAQPVTLTVTASVVNALYPQPFALAVSSVTSHDGQAKAVRPAPKLPNSRSLYLQRVRAAKPAVKPNPKPTTLPPVNKPTLKPQTKPTLKPAVKPPDKKR